MNFYRTKKLLQMVDLMISGQGTKNLFSMAFEMGFKGGVTLQGQLKRPNCGTPFAAKIFIQSNPFSLMPFNLILQIIML